MAAADTDKYYLEKAILVEDNDSEFQYEEVPVDDDFLGTELDEDLDFAVRTINEGQQDKDAAAPREAPKATVAHRPEVVDDFVRNFLVRMGMFNTLDSFQQEWYALQQKGQLGELDIGVVPDIYVRNEDLKNETNYLRQEADKYREASLKAKEMYSKLRKQRDLHRMHHNRVEQENQRLIAEIKRLKRHFSDYEPAMQQMKHKYEVAMKGKMLTQLERDRAMGQVQGLQSTLRNIDSNMADLKISSFPGSREQSVARRVEEMGPTQKRLVDERARWEGKDVRQETEPRHPDDTEFPPDNGVNPYLAQVRGQPGHLTRSGGFRQSNQFQAHSHAVSGVALHPRKQILATTSDDRTWKLWSVPSGDIIMTGEGHTDWVSDCDFHPSGSKLATVSGDTTVKLWDFTRAECVHTFTDHSHAVWGCSWHSCGDFLATASLDNTAKVWDMGSMRCRYTLRGHADSVNSVQFLPFSNTLLTCSADKTISLWDARTSLCAQTFFGHMHSVNHVTFNLKGDTIASCDSYGVLKLWDVRTVAPMASVDCGPHPANHVAIDPSGQVVAVSSNDSTVKMYEVANGQLMNLVGHEDAVQCCVFDRSGEFMVSGGSDLTVRIWS